MTHRVRCRARWDTGNPQDVGFLLGEEIQLHLADQATLGPAGLTPAAADLLDLGAAIFWIERRLLRRKEPPRRLNLTFPARDPEPWTEAATSALAGALGLLGNARWTIRVAERRKADPPPSHEPPAGGSAEAVALFSGGLDSTCGVATLMGEPIPLVSFYSVQRRQQREIAQALGFPAPAQWRIARSRVREPGRSFHYRSFFFLCLAAASASSWGARRILQFENGVLASSIPPSPAWAMTKHAHPELHDHAGRLFGTVLGGRWTVENPFFTATKRQCVEQARRAAGADRFDPLPKRTESCWHQRSNHLPGAVGKRRQTGGTGQKKRRRREVFVGPKKPGRACGICIPCLVRRTALGDRDYARDMSKARWQNHRSFGRDFRAYYGFLDRIRRADSLAAFYLELPAPGRHLFAADCISPEDLHRLFRTFADEFMTTFEV